MISVNSCMQNKSFQRFGAKDVMPLLKSLKTQPSPIGCNCNKSPITITLTSEPHCPSTATHLFTNNKSVDKHNKKVIDELNTQKVTVRAFDDHR
jgi:hypothetical protein